MKTIKIRYQKKVKCNCGCEIVKCSLNRHMKSKKHINLMEQLKSITNNKVIV